MADSVVMKLNNTPAAYATGDTNPPPITGDGWTLPQSSVPSSPITNPKTWADVTTQDVIKSVGQGVGDVINAPGNAVGAILKGADDATGNIVSSVGSGIAALFDPQTWEGAALYLAGFVLMFSLIAFGTFSLTRGN